MSKILPVIGPEDSKAILLGLIEVEKLLVNPANWTTMVEARSSDGSYCSPSSIDAISWCAVGALQLMIPDNFLRGTAIAFIEGISQNSIVFLNDYGGHSFVMEAIRNAIKRLQFQLTTPPTQGESE